MLISRYLIDATGRQGTPRDQRRQHVLVVDEAQRFDTRALGKIAVEGRKFGLALALASQSLGGLGERLRDTILTNAASLALLAPGADDVRGLARLVAPVRRGARGHAPLRGAAADAGARRPPGGLRRHGQPAGSGRPAQPRR